MNQSVSVQVLQRRGQRQADAQALSKRQPASFANLAADSLGDVGIGVLECWSVGVLNCRPFPITPALHRSITPFGSIIGQFHDVVEIAALFVAAHVQNVNLAFMGAGDWLELLNAFELPLERTGVIKGRSINDFDRPISAHDVPREPNLAVTAAPNATEQFVIGNGGQSDANAEVARSRRGRAEWTNRTGVRRRLLPWRAVIHGNLILATRRHKMRKSCGHQGLFCVF